MDRRDVLKTLAGTFGMVVGRRFTTKRANLTRWSGHVVLPVGYTIPAGSEVEFDPGVSTTVEASGNVVVYGTLRMRPASRRIVHTLRFTGVDEAAFVGGGMDPLPSDVGLWVMEGGRLLADGAAKTSWARARAIGAGDRSLRMTIVPDGWGQGDEIAICPTLPPTSPDYLTSEVRTIQAIDGDRITLSSGVTYAHPSVTGPLGVFGPEVLNLTRNVRIEGTPSGRSHVFLRPSRPQALSYVAMRFMGPRKDRKGVLGRYGVHFHMAEDATRGSEVDGVVVRDSGNHAFVPHFSHGITFRDCVAFATVNDAYWWDRVPNDLSGPDNIDNYPYTISNGIEYRRCVAADVTGLALGETYRMCGFSLNRGEGSRAIGCVAVGIQMGTQNSGFQWPENNHGDWLFQDCVSHNNKSRGAFIWQNTMQTVKPARIERFATFHNLAGIHHGAYISNFQFERCWFFGNTAAGVGLSAQSRQPEPIRYRDCTFDGAGIADFAMLCADHNFSGELFTLFERCRFGGANVACVAVLNPTRQFDLETFRDCTYHGNEFWLADGLDPRSIIHVDDPQHGRILLRPKGQPGTHRPAWNASVSPWTAGT